MTTVLTLILFYLVFILTPVSASTRSFSYKQRRECLIKADQIIFSFTARSKQDCVVRATSFGHITSSWNAVSSTCKVSDIDTTNDSPTLVHCDLTPGWTTVTQKRYPVFQARGPNGFNDLTYIQADSLCQNFGTILASPGDLISAKGMGYELCVCGWLSDGSIGFVMQTYKSWCWYTHSEGINYCYDRDYADAYCLLK